MPLDDALRVMEHDPALLRDLDGLVASGLLHAASALREFGLRVEVGPGGTISAHPDGPAYAMLLPAGPVGPRSDAGGRLCGPGIASVWGPMAACIAALRVARKHDLLRDAPILLLGGSSIAELAAIAPAAIPGLRFDGSVAPRVWPGCFGSFDVLIRVRGRRTEAGISNMGINALEEAVPLLVALQGLGREIEARSVPLPTADPDLPLSGRLSLVAVHGGQQGTPLPALCDILLNRRYTPFERFERAIAEVHDVIDASAAQNGAFGVDTMVSDHRPPVPEPNAAHRTRALAALAKGYGWPHDPIGFSDGAPERIERLGGLVPPGMATGADEWTTMPALRALSRTVLAYLADAH